jgi:hypothetical protein
MDAQRLVIEHTFGEQHILLRGDRGRDPSLVLNPYPRAGRGRIDAFQSAGPDEEHER